MSLGLNLCVKESLMDKEPALYKIFSIRKCFLIIKQLIFKLGGFWNPINILS